MSVDLRTNGMFARVSLVVMDDSLVKLEHGRTEDRVRRFMFDSIDRVMIWRTWPWVRMLLVTLLMVLPGAALVVLPQDEGAKVFGGILLAIGLGLVLYYTVCRHTTIRIVRGNDASDVRGVFRPGKLRKFRTKLVDGIRAAQATA